MKKKYVYIRQGFFFYLVVHILFVLLVGCNSKRDSPFSESARDALSTFELEPGFKIELIAAEPLISDPVDMEIDEYGRLYVVQMKGVPYNKSGTGQVKLLTDTDGDGQMDKSVVFADSLILPSGIMRWKKGMLVTDPPSVLYFEDLNGDDCSDVRKTVLTGFDSSDLESNVNNPLYGLDNWIYMGNGGSSKGDIYYPGAQSGPRLPENARGRMVRFRPDTKELEMLSSRTQFGHSFDAWGNHLLVNNSNHLFQEVIAARYLNRNPDLLISSATQTLSDHSSEVFPITKNPENQLLTDVGVFTAACGITSYLGANFPKDYQDNLVFVAEPAHNLVHVDRIKPQGASFTGSRLDTTKEFLASTDPWFRPVNMYVGPDGALYLVDYYRQFIEGPAFMAEEILKTANLYNGTDKGRIYRISRTDAQPAGWTKGVNLGDLSVGELVEKLADANIWWRRNAQRLLVDKNSAEAAPALVRMAQNSSSSMGRLHALWVLEGIHHLTTELIRKALKDNEPGIRENAIKLAELHLNDDPKLKSSLLTLQADPDPKVRYQLLCTLGFINTPEVNQVRQQLLFKDINDPWIQTAALTAPSIDNLGLLEAVLAHFDPDIPAYTSLVELLSSMMGASVSPKIIHGLFLKATAQGPGNQSWKAAVLNGLAKGIRSRKSLASEFAGDQGLMLRTCLEHPSVPVRESSLRILRVIGLPGGNQTGAAMAQARHIAENVDLDERQRAGAIDVLALHDVKPHASFLGSLINPREPLPVQLAALRGLSSLPDLTVTQYVLQEWPRLTPEIRDAALGTFMTNSDRVSLLLDAVETGKIQAANIGWPRSVTLMAGRWPKPNGFTSRDSTLRDRARALLTKKEDKRKDVIQAYQGALKLKGDPSRGKALFVKNCAICHQIRGEVGVSFGPDLGTVRNWPPGDIMSNILDPNQSITIGYDLWDVILNSGESLQGIISTETPTAITLRNAGGMPSTIARKDIKSLTALGVSTMPTGLEKQISKQEMADILAYLKGR